MKLSVAFLSLLFVVTGCTSNGLLGGFEGTETKGTETISNEYTFNGYTNHWQNLYQQQYRVSNLYRINIPDLNKTIAQTMVDLAESMGIPGLQVQDGFFNGLTKTSYIVLDNPTIDEIEKAFDSSNAVLVFADNDTEAAQFLNTKKPEKSSNLSSYQSKAPNFSPLDAFVLKKRNKSLYAAIGRQSDIDKLKPIIEGAMEVIDKYEMKRGWFGTATNIQSVTCMPGTPIDVMGRGMNEGNSWFVFSGGYETHSKDKIYNWAHEAGLSIVTDLGASPLFGCDDWEGFQSQLMGERDSWIKLREKKHGYLFKNVGPAKGEVDRTSDSDYDGYFANVGHEKQINSSDKPFVIMTGNLLGGTTSSMILFHKKGEEFNRESMWSAIMERRSVAVGEKATVMGSDLFRKSIQLMMLDREYIEDYFGDRIDITAIIEGTKLKVTLSNLYDHKVDGSFSVKLPAQVAINDPLVSSCSLQANSTKELEFDLNPSEEAMGRLSAIAVQFDWDNSSKAVMAKLDMPPAVSVHQLLYGSSSGTKFPVSIYNFTNDENVDVSLTVSEKDDPSKVVYSDEKKLTIQKGSYQTTPFNLTLKPGSYIVKTDAMGVTATTQLGIGEESGIVTVTPIDLNGDGVDEYVMENNSVRVTLLTTGARVIEYFVKSRNDNVFFKLWPDKPDDVNRPFRERAFWPFGGFEDFLGQASMETHKVYDAEIIKKDDNYAEVKMTAAYYGNVIEKTFSLYGDTPLLGIRFALDMINPELDVLGPQPIVSLGEKHGPEDTFIIPEIGGQQKYVMNPKRMYGKILDLQEGWNAGYDTIADVSFVGAYPVHRPFYLHMWMNLDTNPDSHYPYVELQPWVPLYHNSTSYFSYYMWAAGDSWEKGVKALRDRNLITER